jgi:AraC family transcriptional regulator
MLDIATKPVEALLFRSDVVAIGAFRCAVSHPLYRDSGPCSHHTIVFPRTVTGIRHADGPSFLGSPNTVSFYNQHQLYTRQPVSDADRSDWYVVADDALRDAIAAHDPAVADRPARPFPFACGPSDPDAYVTQRALFDRLATDDAPDALEVEETVLRVLARVLAGAYASRPRLTAPMREAVEEVKRVLSRRPEGNATLRELAAGVETSPFHLCRAFKRATGVTLTAYRHDLRLRLALDRLHGRTDLTDLALDLGYSSHSHFTRVFRRHFGVTPSAWTRSRDLRCR